MQDYVAQATIPTTNKSYLRQSNCTSHCIKSNLPWMDQTQIDFHLVNCKREGALRGNHNLLCQLKQPVDQHVY